MNIINFLKDKNTVISLKYYGKNDIATGYQIKTLIDCKNEINRYYSDMKFHITNIDECIDFLFADMCSKLSEITPLVSEEIKNDFEEELRYMINIRNRYKISDFNKYIKDNFNDILNRELLKQHQVRDYEFIDVVLDYIKDNFKIFKECKELYEYIIKNYCYEVFYKFKDYKIIFDNYPDLLTILFDENKLKEEMSIKFSYFEEALKYAKNKNNELYEKTIAFIVSEVKSRAFNTNVDRVMYTYNEVKNTKELFEKIGDKHFKEFQDEEKKQNKVLEEYLHKNGQKYSFEVNIEEFVKVYERKDIEWEIKSLLITHCKHEENIVSRFNQIMTRERKKSLVDFAATNISTNEYFTYSLQEELSIMMMFGKLMIKYLIGNEESFNELMKYYFSSVCSYIDKFNITIQNIEDDFNMLGHAIETVINEFKSDKKDELIIKLCNYNVLHLLIGIFEKILREILYTQIQEDRYVPYSKLTLENILKLPEAESLLGQSNTRVFQYYLTNYNYVGFNLRNDICHFNNNISDICTLDNVLTVMYLLLTLTNELLIKVIDVK